MVSAYNVKQFLLLPSNAKLCFLVISVAQGVRRNVVTKLFIDEESVGVCMHAFHACGCAWRTFWCACFFFVGTSFGKMREIVAQQEMSVKRRRQSCNGSLNEHNFKQLNQPTSFCGPARHSNNNKNK